MILLRKHFYFFFWSCSFWQVVGVPVALIQIGVAGLISSLRGLYSFRVDIARSLLKCQQQSEYQCHSDVGPSHTMKAKDTDISSHSHQCELETKNLLSANQDSLDCHSLTETVTLKHLKFIWNNTTWPCCPGRMDLWMQVKEHLHPVEMLDCFFC